MLGSCVGIARLPSCCCRPAPPSVEPVTYSCSQSDPSRAIGEIVISPDAKGNAYTNNIYYTHSSDLVTMQEIFNVGPCLRDACNANDLSDLFVAGAIPGVITANAVPEPTSGLLLAGGLITLGMARRRIRH